MDDKKISEFLNRIGQIESSGGKNTNHRTITTGIQAGDSAYGTYGLMPNTIDELAGQSEDPKIQALTDLDADEKKQYLSAHPEIEQALAKTLANKVLTNQGGDEEKAAYAWNAGHNLTPDKIEARDYKNSDYVQKYDDLASQSSKNSKTNNSLSMQGTPEGSKLMAYLTGKEQPTPDNLRSPAAGLTMGSIPGLGGMGGGMSDTLALNNSQRAATQEAIANMVKGPASEEGSAGIRVPSLYTDPTVRSIAQEDPNAVPAKLGRPPGPYQFTPVQPPAFNMINKLISDYKNKGQ